jgi:hypothetical protein
MALGKAQKVPGYLGKRLVVNYELSAIPSFYNPNSGGYVSNPGRVSYSATSVPFSITLKHFLNAEYVVSKKTSVKTSLGYFNSVYGNRFDNSNFNLSDLYLEDLGTLNNFGFQAGIKRYRNHFAPLGKYFELRVGLELINYGELNFLVPENSFNEQPAFERAVPGGTAVVGGAYIGWGTSRIINDSFILNYGIELGFVYPSGQNANNITNIFFDDQVIFLDPSTQSDAAINEAMREASIARVFSQSLLNFKIGVGILP